jgi:hypothetical protein
VERLTAPTLSKLEIQLAIQPMS